MNINLDIAFNKLSIHYVIVAMILKKPHTFFSSALISTLLLKTSWAMLKISKKTFNLKTKFSQLKRFCMAVLTTTRLLAGLNSIKYLISTKRFKYPLLIYNVFFMFSFNINLCSLSIFLYFDSLLHNFNLI